MDTKPPKFKITGAYAIGKGNLSSVDPATLPKSFYVGQDYIEDPVKFPCYIEFSVYSPGIIEPFEFFLNKKRVRINQSETFILARIEIAALSQKLFNDIKTTGRGESFILAEIAQFLPKINEELMRQKYLSGHLLIKTFSIFDINHIFLRKTDGEVVVVDWPQTLPSYPPSQALAKDDIYVRDLLNAINHYFDKNFDDCIRNLVTSVENFVRTRGLRGKSRFLFFRRNSFVSVLKNNLAGPYIGNEVVRENMIFIYRIRNKIVHNDFRIKNSNGWGCVKGIGTVTYLFRLLGKDPQLNLYMKSLQGQFILLRNFCGDAGNTLEAMEKVGKAPPGANQVIQTPQDLDRFVFEGLRFSAKEKGVFLQGR
jgi:hypothetical protein